MERYKNLLRKIAHAQAKHPVVTLMIILAITLILMGGVARVKTVAALENMMPPSLEEISAFNTLRDQGRGQDMIAIVIELNPESTILKTDILTYDIYEHVALITETVAAEQDVIQVHSLASILEGINGGPVDEATFGTLLQEERVKEAISSYTNAARTNTLIIITTDVSANDERMNLLANKVEADLKSIGHPPGVRHKLTGTPIIQQELGTLINRDRQVTKNISTLFVFLVVMLIFGTVTSALVPIAVVTLSVTWLYGIMGYTGLPISTLAGGVAAMVIGIGIDYAIHLMNRYKHERKLGKEVEAAIEEAVADTGVATTGAAITTVLAFIAFLTGAMPEMHRFGLLMTIGVTSSLILTITALPAMLILEERLFFRLRKHLHFGVEGEYFLATKEEIAPPGYRQIKQEEHRKVSAEVTERFTIHKRAGGKKR